MKITTKLLESLDACEDQVALFRATFGDDGDVPTVANIERAVAAGLDIEWLVSTMFTAPARAECGRVTAAARAEYDRVTAAAWAEYGRVTAAAWAVGFAAL